MIPATWPQACGPRPADDGSGGTVLALHSLGLDSRSFEPLRASLPSGWQLLAIDLPGHGPGPWPARVHWRDYLDTVSHAIERAEVEHVHLLGHSLGGALVAQLAAQLPHKVCSLTLIATPAQGLPAFAERGLPALEGGMGAVLDDTLQRWFGEALPAGGAAVDYARDCLLRMYPQAFADAWQALAQFPGYGPIAGHLPPTLLISAELDRSTPPAVMTGILDTLQRGGSTTASQHVVAGAGHMVTLTHPQEVAQLVLQHWQRHGALKIPQLKDSLA